MSRASAAICTSSAESVGIDASILAHRDLSAQARSWVPAQLYDPAFLLICKRVRRREPHQKLAGQRARSAPQHVVAGGRARPAQVQARADDAAAGPVDEAHFGAVNLLDDPDVREATPIRIA